MPRNIQADEPFNRTRPRAEGGFLFCKKVLTKVHTSVTRSAASATAETAAASTTSTTRSAATSAAAATAPIVLLGGQLHFDNGATEIFAVEPVDRRLGGV